VVQHPEDLDLEVVAGQVLHQEVGPVELLRPEHRLVEVELLPEVAAQHQVDLEQADRVIELQALHPELVVASEEHLLHQDPVRPVQGRVDQAADSEERHHLDRVLADQGQVDTVGPEELAG
jgi:hypothetical protein